MARFDSHPRNPLRVAPPSRASLLICACTLGLGETGCSSEPVDEVASTRAELATPIYLRPTDDAMVASGLQANTSYGSATSFQVDLQNNQNNIALSYLRFQIGSVAGGIGRARLRLQLLSGSADTANLYATSNTSWNEETVTWNSQPGFGSAPAIATLGATSAGQVVYIDVTDVIQPNSTITFALVPRSVDAADFASKEHPTARRPSLIIDNITACTPPVEPPTAFPGCPVAPAHAPADVTALMTDVESGVTVTQLTTGSNTHNIAYYDIPAVVGGSNRFVYSRVIDGSGVAGEYTASMNLDGSDPRYLSNEPDSVINTFLTPDGAMAYFARKTSGGYQLRAANLRGANCNAVSIAPSYPLGDGAGRMQISTASRNCETDKWVIAFATDRILHRIKGKGADGPWASMGDFDLTDHSDPEPATQVAFHRLRLSPACPNIVMYSLNKNGDGEHEIYLADLDRQPQNPLFLGYGKRAKRAGLTSFDRVPGHEMWSHDGLRVSFTHSTLSTFEPRQLVIADVLNPDCTFRTTNPDGTSNMQGTTGLAARTFKASRVFDGWSRHVPKFCSWSADDQLMACSGYQLVHGVEGPSAIFLLNPNTGATRFLTTTDELPGQEPYLGQSHLQFAGDKTTILFDSDRRTRWKPWPNYYLPPQVYKVTYPASLLPP